MKDYFVKWNEIGELSKEIQKAALEEDWPLVMELNKQYKSKVETYFSFFRHSDMTEQEASSHANKLQQMIEVYRGVLGTCKLEHEKLSGALLDFKKAKRASRSYTMNELN